MKTRYFLPALLIMGATFISTQAQADGLTYDPYADYYSKYYGIGKVSQPVENSAQDTVEFYDPYAEYYNTYYGINYLSDKKVIPKAIEVTPVTPTNDMDMADPSNYYNW